MGLWDYGLIQSLGPKVLQAGSKAGPGSLLPLCPDVGAPQGLSPHVALRSNGRRTKRDDPVRNVEFLSHHPPS